MAERVLVMGAPGKRTVDESSELVKKLYFIERELMRALGGYEVNVARWELKRALPRHIWEDSLRADALRTRVLEMRYPRRDVDQGHDPRLADYLSSLIRCRNDAELIIGVYFVTKQTLIDAYETYLRDADPLDDAPTIAFMSDFPAKIRKQIEEIEVIYTQLPENDGSNHLKEWRLALESFLTNIGGLYCKENGNGVVPAEISGRSKYVPPTIPTRDPRFSSAVYHMPPWEPNKFIERQVWQGINHVNEIWAAEIPALVMWTWNDMPWEFYLDCARWAYDESRHSMMGEERLTAWGFKIGIDYPVVADHYISVSELGELHVFALLHALETTGPGWKSGLKADFEAVGDTASSQDFDYDWADESIHLQYGHKWLLYKLNGDIDSVEDMKENTIEIMRKWLGEKLRQWDYEPFKSRLLTKVAEIEAR